MLEELSRVETDDEDKGQEIIIKQLSKLTTILEVRGKRAEAPSFKRMETRMETSAKDSSSSEDSSDEDTESGSSSSSEEETRKGEKRKHMAKKKEQEKKKKVD